MTIADKLVSKRLKTNKEVVTLPTDKGRITVVMHKTDFYDDMDALDRRQVDLRST